MKVCASRAIAARSGADGGETPADCASPRRKDKAGKMAAPAASPNLDGCSRIDGAEGRILRTVIGEPSDSNCNSYRLP